MNTIINTLHAWWDPHYAVAGASFALVLVSAVLATKAVRAASRSNLTLEDTLTWIVAAIATAVSAEGSYQVFAGVIKERWLLWSTFAVIELIMLVSAVRARKHMQRFGSSGVDGIAVWVFAGLTATLASLHALSKGHLIEFLVRLAAPLMAAWLWERGMRLARMIRTGRKRINWTVGIDRILVRLGLAEPEDRSTSEVATQRRLTRLAVSTFELRTLENASDASERKLKRAINRQRNAAIAAAEHTDLATNSDRQREFQAIHSMLVNAKSLTDLTPAAFWAPRAEAQSPYPPVFVPDAVAIPETVTMEPAPPVPVLSAAKEEPKDHAPKERAPKPAAKAKTRSSVDREAVALFLKKNPDAKAPALMTKFNISRASAYRLFGEIKPA